MTALHEKTALTIATEVASGHTTARQVIEATLARIDAVNPRIGAFTDVTHARALAKADALDAAARQGGAAGRLAGVPFAVKNLFDLEGVTTRAGSRINRDHPAAARDSTLVEKLEGAGAICVGALNMGEYAYDFTGENIHDGPSRNPHDLTRMTGGSSGGSGGAVAAGLVPISLGSDTNGSIRVPASLCGLFGLKPTYGRLSRARTFPFVASLDHLGPLARSVADLALSYDVMQGEDPDDPALAPRPVELTSSGLGQGARGLRIAAAGGYFADKAEPHALAAVRHCAEALGATRTVQIPEAHRARAAAFVITTTEGAALHLERLKTRPQDFDPAVRDRLLAGAMIPAAWVNQAHKFRRWFKVEVAKLFESVDVILAPATPCSAPKLGQTTMVLGGETLNVRANMGLFTQPISFIGLPVVAVPVWRDGAMPIGVQVIGPAWREDIVLRVAAALEAAGVCGAPVADVDFASPV
ncbi:AtzE family amidohydrolase [Lichenifustis flavocetrariae]|uniref:AtzE family amidohydrolase n=1 Tax=Lichenifustis flavocetrariae TaxID=2949735 RepID=A0AA41YV13_9HYPH|nr:AtzE family amidohydrolase [Lichenifustis flavocetrariae]MCW6509089.1 AtzE family amidohydrolase [Lichenifustis flavocetrariae]